MWRNLPPSGLAGAIFVVIGLATGGDRKSVLVGGGLVGAATFAIATAISLVIGKAIAHRRRSDGP